MSTPKIVTEFWLKPIPPRDFDWTARLDNYDGDPDAGRQPVGYGATKDEAIADLKEQIDWNWENEP